MTADPMTRRLLDEIEQKRKAREGAEAEERRFAERLAALSPDERAGVERRVRDLARSNTMFWIGISIIVISVIASMIGTSALREGESGPIWILILLGAGFVLGLVVVCIADHLRWRSKS